MSSTLWNSNYLKIWIGNFLIHFSFTLIVPLLPVYLADTFGAGKDTIGLVLAGYSVMALLVRPFSGFIVDSFPRRTVLFVCNFLFVAIFAGYLMAGSLVMFAIFRTVHGLPFGAATVSASTVAIDVLPADRRNEGIGYYGLSNNLAMVLGPALAIYLLQAADGNFKLLFWLSMIVSFAGLVIDSTIRHPERELEKNKKVLSLDRFFLVDGLPEALCILSFSMCYGVVSTYVAIYGRETLGILGGAGLFFSLFAAGLIVSRLTGAKALRENRIAHNADFGILVAAVGFLIFAAVRNPWGYYCSAFIIGLGNGRMYPAFLNMFVNLAGHKRRGTANSSILTAWDAGVGLGVLFGGVIAEHFGYHWAFWFAFAAETVGGIYYFCYARGHFNRSKHPGGE